MSTITAPPTTPSSPLQPFRDRLRGQGIYLLLVGTWVATWSIIFLDGGTPSITSLLVRSVGLGILAAGQTAVIIGGSIDLSVAWLLTVCAMLAASIADGDGSKLPLAIAVTLAVGLGVGATNGLIVTKLRVHGFVATLGSGLILNGVLSMTFAENAPASMPSSIVNTLGFGELGPVPWSVVLLIAVVLLAGWLLTRTRTGSHIYAVGGGDDVARLSGIRADRALIAAHAFSGLTAAIAGLYLASRLGTPNVELGTNGVYDLESIAVVVLGGAALAGGKGRAGATLAAVLVFALVDSAFNQLEVDPFLKLVVRGGIIIAAVASYTLRSGEEAQ